jgi:hypothetical protein
VSAIFQPQTEAQIRAALASKCNLLPLQAQEACRQLAASGPIVEKKPAVPAWLLVAGGVTLAYLLFRR